MPTLLTTLIRVTPPSLPANYCFTTVQQLANDLFTLAVFSFQSSIGNIAYNWGDTVPSPENQIFPWRRTIGGWPDDEFQFVNGAWHAMYRPVGAGPNGARWWYEGSEASLKTFEGGEDAGVDINRGPFWEVDHNYDGRLAMGAGSIFEANPSKTLAVGENFGEGSHLMKADEVGPHTHPINAGTSIQNGRNVKVVASGGGSAAGLLIGGSGNADTDLSIGAHEYTTDQERVPVIAPVRGGFWIKRTRRAWRRIDP